MRYEIEMICRCGGRLTFQTEAAIALEREAAAFRAEHANCPIQSVRCLMCGATGRRDGVEWNPWPPHAMQPMAMPTTAFGAPFVSPSAATYMPGDDPYPPATGDDPA